jgi:lysyl-tRNA synthetase class II
MRVGDQWQSRRAFRRTAVPVRGTFPTGAQGISALNYGTVHIRGTGAGIGNLTMIANALDIRSAIAAPAVDRAES